MHCSTTIVLMVAVTFFLVLNVGEAKRGCASFGHSCYGGMGKRASDGSEMQTNEEILQNVQDEENPAFVFTGPRSFYQTKPYQKISPQQYDNISKIVRQWIQSYRRAQQEDNTV